MSPILQSIANGSARGYGALLAAAGAATSFESIATVSVGSGGSASAEFTSIPSGYAHLQVRAYARDTGGSGTYEAFKLEFNSDSSTSNYAFHMLYGTGAAAGADATTSGTFGFIYLDTYPSNGAIANNFSGGILDILDYGNTNKYKTIRWLGGHDNNGTGSTDGRKGFINLKSGLWMSTSAITSIKLTAGATSFAQYSHFALYGIKSA